MAAPSLAASLSPNKKLTSSDVKAIGVHKMDASTPISVLVSSLIEETNWQKRAAIVQALEGNPGEFHIAQIVSEIGNILLKDQDWTRRDKAAQALALFGGSDTIGYFIKAFSDQSQEVYLSVVRGLREKRNEALDPLISALRDEDPNIRFGAALVLGDLADDKAVQPLIQALRDTDIPVQMQVIAALGELANKEACAPLFDFLHNSHSGIRASAVSALGQLGPIDTIEPILFMLKDEDIWVRISTAQALGELEDSRALAALEEIMQKSERDSSDEKFIVAVQDAHAKIYRKTDPSRNWV